MIHDRKYSELFDFHSAPKGVDSGSTGMVVFGRKDTLVAHALVDQITENNVDWAVITGGMGGKDSGDLDIPEAEYLAREAERLASERLIDLPPIILETQAKNGGENSRNSLDAIRRLKFGHETLAVVSHATSLRRLAHLLNHTAAERGAPIDTLYRIPSKYQFDVQSPSDRDEVIDETIRLLEWPRKGWLKPEAAAEVPANLADFALEVVKKRKGF